MVGPIVGAMPMMMVPFVVMFAVVMMLSAVMTGWVVRSVLGDGAASAAHGERESNSQRR